MMWLPRAEMTRSRRAAARSASSTGTAPLPMLSSTRTRSLSATARLLFQKALSELAATAHEPRLGRRDRHVHHHRNVGELVPEHVVEEHRLGALGAHGGE